MIAARMLALPLVFLVAITAAASPVAFVVMDADDRDDDEPCKDLVTVSGEITKLIYSGRNKNVTGFVIDDEVNVSMGPWWYWLGIKIDLAELFEVGDEVRVTGEWEMEKDGSSTLCAWHVENLTTDEELTIKEEGRPPWAGGPKALGIDPWPSSKSDE